MRLRALLARAPSLATSTWFYLQLRRQARDHARAGRDNRGFRQLAVPTPDGRLLEIAGHDLRDLRVTAGPISASQKYDELMPLLDRIGALNAQRVCEIGTSAGGTLYLLTRVASIDALIVSIDLSIPLHTRALRERFGRRGQRVVSIEGDSGTDQTRAALEELLAGQPLDVLLIDGDHSYDGVRRDFERYGPLVRPEGIIALHDIVQDYRTSRGLRTGTDSGDVPRFWNELKQSHRTEELIADPEQDGYGIGLVIP
jgi:predicted O-methyltransferase YrrM